MKKGWVIAVVLLLSACSQGLSGTYADSMGLATYTFASDGKVTVTVMGNSQETSYVRDKDSVKVQVPGQEGATLDFTVDADGALHGPMGVQLKKVDGGSH